MQFELRPYKTIGPLVFGDSRADVRECFDNAPEVVAMAEGRLPNEQYKSSGIFVIYDKYDRFAAAEISRPAQPTFEKKNLLSIPWEELITWFRKLDPKLEESEKDFVSFKLGISAFAPNKDKNPKVLPTSITVFRENFFYVKDGIPDPQDVNSFHLHVAHVEPIEQQNLTFDGIEQAFQTAFAKNREFALLLWNGVPIKFTYTVDLPLMLKTVLSMLEALIEKGTGTHTLEFDCPAFTTRWDLKWDEKFIQIESHWDKVDGGYEAALNEEAEEIFKLLLLKKEFVFEWKMLLQQCRQAFELSGASLNQVIDRELIRLLRKLERQISHFGKFYKKQEKLITTQADDRKKVDFRKLPQWAQYILIALILVLVVVPAYLLSKDKNSPFWMLKNLRPIVLYLTPFLLITFYWIYRINKRIKS
ncbi:MAG: hypothetical protein H6558_12180 [Lewinellaceae bacterium]|nr:hypothetical protein [Phaeodactylibacter sp.]MCB9265775.1 hypothetical protein [Lewinellaceae bacterium]MCB9352582.1 hypothetical protein [Lewinellaceae bacterium]